MIVQIKEIAMRVAKQGRTVGIFWGKKKQMDYSDVFDFGYEKRGDLKMTSVFLTCTKGGAVIY